MNAKLIGLAIALSIVACDNMDIKKDKQEAPKKQPTKPQVYKGLLDLSSDLVISSNGEDIIFAEGTQIITNGFKLEIIANNIEFQNAGIKTFAESKADPAQNGGHGGQIKIIATYAAGALNININGQDGGDGIEPPQLGEEFRGPKGQDGAPAQYMWYVGAGAAGNVCVANPTNGAQGGKGIPGKPGIKAGDGGNSARLEINILDASQLTLNQNTPRAGLGGKEALGGRGSPGGYGGFAGVNNPQNIKKGDSPCPYAANGPEGEEGDRGPKGLQGVEGKVKPVCLKLSHDRPMECK